MHPDPRYAGCVERSTGISAGKRRARHRWVARRRRAPVDRERDSREIRRHDHEVSFTLRRADRSVRKTQCLDAAADSDAARGLEARVGRDDADDRCVGRPGAEQHERSATNRHDVRTLRHAFAERECGVRHRAAVRQSGYAPAPEHRSDAGGVDHRRDAWSAALLRFPRRGRGSGAALTGLVGLTCGGEPGRREERPRRPPPAPEARPRPRRVQPRHPTVAQHSISTRAPNARPLAPSALRAGLWVGKYVA